MVATAKKMGGSMARPRKQLTKREQRTPKGRFATHLAGLLADRRWSTEQAAAAFGVGEPTVRKWLRAESVPETLDLERIGKALGLADYRHVLPPT